MASIAFLCRLSKDKGLHHLNECHSASRPIGGNVKAREFSALFCSKRKFGLSYECGCLGTISQP